MEYALPRDRSARRGAAGRTVVTGKTGGHERPSGRAGCERPGSRNRGEPEDFRTHLNAFSAAMSPASAPASPPATPPPASPPATATVSPAPETPSAPAAPSAP